jgi:hypothetical protein
VKHTYSLSPYEEGIAAEVGYQRQKVYFGQPWKNVNYSEGDVWEMWQHAVCAGAELAAARMMGLEDFTPHYNTFKSKLDIPGYEVRYAFSTKPPRVRWSLRFNPDRDDLDQVYILIVGGLEDKSRRYREDGWLSPAYRAIGWMYGHEMVHDNYRADYNRNQYSVPFTELHDMAKLPVVETDEVSL